MNGIRGITEAVGIVLLANLVGLAGYQVSHRWNVQSRKDHTDILGQVAGITGMIIAVVLAFVVFATWTYYDRAQATVDKEAGTIWQIWNDVESSEQDVGHPVSQALSDSVTDDVSGELRSYVTFVADSEWALVVRGVTARDLGSDPAIWHLRNAYNAVLQQKGNAGRGAAAMALTDEIVRRFNTLLDVRQDRIAYGQRGALGLVVWLTLILGGILCLACCWLLGFEDARLHRVVIFTVATSLGLVLVLIVALNSPFKGIAPISNGRFAELSQQIADWERADSLQESHVRRPKLKR